MLSNYSNKKSCLSFVTKLASNSLTNSSRSKSVFFSTLPNTVTFLLLLFFNGKLLYWGFIPFSLLLHLTQDQRRQTPLRQHFEAVSDLHHGTQADQSQMFKPDNHVASSKNMHAFSFQTITHVSYSALWSQIGNKWLSSW